MKTAFSILALIFFLGNSNAQVLNIEKERIRTDTTGWSGSGQLSFNLLSNVQKLAEFGLEGHLQYKTYRSLYLALSDYELINSGKSDYSNKGMLHLRYNYKLSKLITYEGFMQGQFNKVLNLEFRGLLGSGLRFKMIGHDKLRLYSGLAYMFEYELPSGEVAEEYNHRMSSYLSLSIRPNANFSIYGTMYYQPRIDYFTDYRISVGLDLMFRITRHLYYAVSYEELDDNRPISNVPKITYSLKNKLVLDFGN